MSADAQTHRVVRAVTTTKSPRIELVCACGRRHTVDVCPVENTAVERRVTIALAAAATGVSRWTLRRLALASEIDAVRGARNAILIKVSDVRRWLDSRPVGPIHVDDDPQVNLLDRALKRAGRQTRELDEANLDDTG